LVQLALGDASPYVRIVGAEAAIRFGSPTRQQLAMKRLGESIDWKRNDLFVVMAGLNAVDELGPLGRSLKATYPSLPRTGPLPERRYADYVPRLLNGPE
jgi:hypothetical protein